MPLQPWFKVVEPREDLRTGKPLDASEFAVHLDHVRKGSAPDDYRLPERFFDRTYLATNLLGFAAEVVRRLSGEKTETSAVFNMATQFGGGKTHALTLLYHLAENGPASHDWRGVKRVLEKAGVAAVPQAATAIFVGTEFDAATGSGGDDGTPVRRTPWGDIAYQLGGKEALSLLAEHEKERVAPAGDVIRRMLPNDGPCGLAGQFYTFLHNLSEVARGEDGVVLAVSVPASELEMDPEVQSDYERLKKMLDRVGKAVVMAAEAETSEIIRRRLFEWGGMPAEARKVAAEYADWVVEHRPQIPGWFPVDSARAAFEATYPFHPTVLSVFERKWQMLPRFQRTRGILRLLALWVSKAYKAGWEGAHKDTLIGIGTAPLEDPIFRAAVFEELGNDELEGAVTTDICGRKDAFALRLDEEAVDTIREARLHRKVATTIFFESNGGQMRAEATAPEVRLGVAEPQLDVGNVETVLEALGTACYFLSVEGNRYRFSTKSNLNKILADRRASIKPAKVTERVRKEIQKVFEEGKEIDIVFFPEDTRAVPDRPVLTLVVLAPERSMQSREATLQQIEAIIRECGSKARTFKNALIFAVAEDDGPLCEAATAALAWEDIQDEADELRLDDDQKRKLGRKLKTAARDLRECVWRTYNHLVFLGKGNVVQEKPLGLVHSSAGDTLVGYYLGELRREGEVEAEIGARQLVKNWPPPLTEWSTRAVRDAIYASPLFPKLLAPEAVKATIAGGVSQGRIAYVGKKPGGGYDPFCFDQSMLPDQIEISDDIFIITADEARKHIEPPKLTRLVVNPERVPIQPGKKQTFTAKGIDQHGAPIAIDGVEWTATGGEIDDQAVYTAGEDEGNFLVTARVGNISAAAEVTISKEKKPDGGDGGDKKPGTRTLTWSGVVPSQKWMNFYTKVLSRFAGNPTLKLTVTFEVTLDAAAAEQKKPETETSLRELGLSDQVTG